MAYTPVNRPVSVHLVIDQEAGMVAPRRIRWDGRVYRVESVGMVHRERLGRVRYYVFTVNVGSLDMQVRVNGDNLLDAVLVAVSDGLAD